MLDHINTTAPADADLTVRRAGFDKFEYVRESVRDTNLTHAEHRTLMVIWDHADARTLEAFPGQAAIATSLGIKDRRRVGDLVKSLTRKGYLEIKRQGYSDQASGRNVSTLYGLTLPVRTDEGVGVTSTPTPPGGSGSTAPGGEGVASTPTVGVTSTPLIDQGSDQRTSTTTPGRKDSQDSKTTTGVPDDWTPTPEHKAQAEAKGLDVTHQAEDFRRYNRDKTRDDWGALFDRWLHKARPGSSTSKAGTYRSTPTAKKAPSRVGEHADWMIPRS